MLKKLREWSNKKQVIFDHYSSNTDLYVLTEDHKIICTSDDPCTFVCEDYSDWEDVQQITVWNRNLYSKKTDGSYLSTYHSDAVKTWSDIIQVSAGDEFFIR